MKTKYKIIFGVLAVVVVAFRVSMIPGFQHRSESERAVQGFRSLPRDRVDSAVQSFVGAQKAQGRPVSETVSLRDLVAGGILRAEEAAPFGDVDVLFTISINKTDPQQIIARVRLSSGLVLVELADGSLQQMTQSALNGLDSK